MLAIYLLCEAEVEDACLLLDIPPLKAEAGIFILITCLPATFFFTMGIASFTLTSGQDIFLPCQVLKDFFKLILHPSSVFGVWYFITLPRTEGLHRIWFSFFLETLYQDVMCMEG